MNKLCVAPQGKQDPETQWYREIVLDRDEPSALNRDLVAFRDGGRGIGYDTDDLGDRKIVRCIGTLCRNVGTCNESVLMKLFAGEEQTR